MKQIKGIPRNGPLSFKVSTYTCLNYTRHIRVRVGVNILVGVLGLALHTTDITTHTHLTHTQSYCSVTVCSRKDSCRSALWCVYRNSNKSLSLAKTVSVFAFVYYKPLSFIMVMIRSRVRVRVRVRAKVRVAFFPSMVIVSPPRSKPVLLLRPVSKHSTISIMSSLSIILWMSLCRS